MKKTLILLAGYPGTGKTYMCSKILEQEKDFQVISQDDMKEQFWDEYGFDNMEEKTALENKSWELYYQRIEEAMLQGNRLISDYPFSEKQKPRLRELCEKYGYQAVTIRLVGGSGGVVSKIQTKRPGHQPPSGTCRQPLSQGRCFVRQDQRGLFCGL